MVQCYRQMLRIAVTLLSNFLHFVTSSQKAFVTQRCYIMALRYMSVPALTFFMIKFQKNVTHLKYRHKMRCSLAASWNEKLKEAPTFIFLSGWWRIFWGAQGTLLTPPLKKNCRKVKTLFATLQCRLGN